MIGFFRPRINGTDDDDMICTSFVRFVRGYGFGLWVCVGLHHISPSYRSPLLTLNISHPKQHATQSARRCARTASRLSSLYSHILYMYGTNIFEKCIFRLIHSHDFSHLYARVLSIYIHIYLRYGIYIYICLVRWVYVCVLCVYIFMFERLVCSALCLRLAPKNRISVHSGFFWWFGFRCWRAVVVAPLSLDMRASSWPLSVYI